MRKVTKKAWTFMVFIAGDNNLDPAALGDIAEMAKVGSSRDLNVILQLDRAGDQKTRRFYITRGGGLEKDCIETFDETNTGDPQVLEEFLLWGMEKYPADRYVLVIWNHGGGWWNKPGKARRNICYDDSSEGDALDNQELQGVLLKAAQTRGGKIDILGMDACLMAMLEVAYQFRDSVEVTVGSEEEEPFEGWPYTRILNILRENPGLGTRAVARSIVDEFTKCYQEKGEDVTQSAFNLRSIGKVVQGLDSLSMELIRGIRNEEISKAVSYARSQSPKFFYNNYIDLYRFIELLKDQCSHQGVKEKAGNLLKEVKEDVQQRRAYPQVLQKGQGVQAGCR